jgi:hypothetical protein
MKRLVAVCCSYSLYPSLCLRDIQSQETGTVIVAQWGA